MALCQTFAISEHAFAQSPCHPQPMNGTRATVHPNAPHQHGASAWTGSKPVLDSMTQAA